MKEKAMKVVFLIAACVSILAVALICIFLFANGIPAIKEIGLFDFLTGTAWKPGNHKFGILPMILGSIYVTAGALIVGVPIGILTAVFLAKYCPKKWYRILKDGVDLLAGIPSVVYGFFGNIFSITTWGESHGKGIGVVVDGCPAGLSLCEEDIQKFLDRRKPGQSKFTTQRRESDTVEILSGVFEGKTTGTPISMMVWNKDQHSADYSEIASYYRPGHADFCFDEKYGFRDYRGGGRSSGRETIGRVAGGAIAIKILEQMDISILAYSQAIGPVSIDPARFDPAEISKNKLYMPDATAAAKASAYLEKCLQEQNSSGGIIECQIFGLPVGLGDPVFEKLDANLAKAILSIGAVKGFEIGAGFGAATATGLTNNDAFCMENGHISKRTNYSGGTLGGMSDGSLLFFRAAVKPTPSIAATQQTVNKDGKEIEISIKGRHDPIIVPRAVVVVEAMTAITILDALLSNMTARLDRIIDFYRQ